MSAKDVCTIALLAKQCGATGPVTDLSFRSDAPSGHYQRHLTAVLNLDAPLERAYTMQIPAREKHTIERTTIEIPVMPLESIAEELQMNPGLSFQLRESLREPRVDGAIPPASHCPRRCGWRAGVATGFDTWMACPSKNRMVSLHSMDTIWCPCSDTLLLVWRRSDMCSCGCLGWCPLHVIMRCLAWSFEALAAGQRLRVRHGGTPFTEREAFRGAQGATPCPKGASCI